MCSAQSCIVCLVLLCNCILLWATPARITEWPKLQLFAESARISLTSEIRRSTTSTISASQHHLDSSLGPSAPSSSSPSLSSSPMSSGCTSCRLNNQINADITDHGAKVSVMSAAEKEYRVQAIKRQILEALDLPDPPIMKEDPPEITPEVVESVFGESEKNKIKDDTDEVVDDYEVIHTDKQFILGVAGEANGYNNERTVKLSFSIPHDVQQANLVRGKLWINVLNSSSANKRSIIVTQRFRRKYYVTHVVAIHRAEDARGWIDIELSSTWSANEQPMVLEIITDSAQEAVNVTTRPILEVTAIRHVHGDPHRRVRRSLNCQSNNPTSCCRQSFSVTKAELRWNWIILPAEIEVNYCRGSCESGTNPIYNHSSVMYTRSMSETNANLRAQMMPCCTPKRLGTVQLIYYRDRNILAVKRIPNLKVLECGCA